MADEIKEPEIWIKRIHRTEKINKPRRDESVRFKKAYTGDFQNRKGEEVSKYTLRVNLIYYFVETILASLFNGEPKVRGKTKKDLSQQKAADLLAYNTNYWSYEINARAEFRDAIFDSFFGPAAVYNGWDFVTSKDGMVEKDEPLLRWLDFWEELRVDPDVKRTRRARWMAVRITVPHSEFLEMENIKDEYRFGERAIKPTMRPEDLASDTAYGDAKNNETGDAEWVTYWEVWDREKMERKLVHESCKDEFLGKDTTWPFHLEVKDDPFPVTILHAKTDPFGPMSFSEFKALEDQIWERVRVRSVQAAIIRRIAPKYLFQKGAGTKEQINKFLKSDILSANELNDVSRFGLAPVPEIPQGFYQWDRTLAEDFGNMSGLSEFEAGQLANTATEASIAEGRSNVRKSSREAQIEEFVVTVLTKLAQLCQQLQLRETTFIVNGEDLGQAEPQVFQVTKEQIQGEFELELIPGSMSHVNTESEKRNLLRFFEIAAQTGEVNVREIVAKLATLNDLNPARVMLSDEDKEARAKASAEPTLKFKPIAVEELPSPVQRMRVVEQAMKENGVETLSPGPRLEAGAALNNLQAMPRTAVPVNQSLNLAGNPEPEAPVQPASLTGERG